MKWLGTGNPISDYWGAGNFLAFKVSDANHTATSIKVGVVPSASGMDLVELDEDMNGIFQVTNKRTQKFVIEMTNGDVTVQHSYDFSGLTLEEEE